MEFNKDFVVKERRKKLDSQRYLLLELDLQAAHGIVAY